MSANVGSTQSTLEQTLLKYCCELDRGPVLSRGRLLGEIGQLVNAIHGRSEEGPADLDEDALKMAIFKLEAFGGRLRLDCINIYWRVFESQIPLPTDDKSKQHAQDYLKNMLAEDLKELLDSLEALGEIHWKLLPLANVGSTQSQVVRNPERRLLEYCCELDSGPVICRDNLLIEIYCLVNAIHGRSEEGPADLDEDALKMAIFKLEAFGGRLRLDHASFKLRVFESQIPLPTDFEVLQHYQDYLSIEGAVMGMLRDSSDYVRKMLFSLNTR